MKLGVVQKVLVTDVSESGKFFVQLDTPEAYQIAELSEAIGRDVETNPSLVAPDVGARCYAFSPADQVWYRAVITNVKGREITVYYVDYGNSETVTDISGSSLAGREGRFASPYQAVCCTLSDFVPSDGKWKAGNVATLQELLTNQEFTAMFQSKNLSENHPSLPSLPCYNLTLFRSDSAKESIAQELVKCGLGQYSVCADSLEVAVAVRVFTCFIDSLESFWVQLSARFISLQGIMEEINRSEVICNLTPLPPSALFPGVACCCQFTGDGMFYRAKVTKVSSGEVEVCYVDYGNCEVVTADAVLGIPPHLVVAPAFAVKCSLDGVKPVEHGQQAWSAEACDKFVELSEGRELEAVVTSIYPSEVFGVELRDCSSESNIREVLINCGVARLTEAAPNAPESIVPKPIVPDPTIPESTPELQYVSLDVGQQYKVLITCVESPSVVWCQRTEYTSELDRVMIKLSSTGPHLPALTRPSVDQVCCVQYVEDESWCRGVIQSIDSAASKADVLFVDFGNVERVGLPDLRRLDSELLSVPAQAVSFSMHEVVPQRGEGWAPDATVKFRDLILERELICQVMGLDQDGYPSVKLQDPQRVNGDIGFEFARLGYAKAPPASQKKLAREEGRAPFKSYSQQSVTRNSTSQSSQKSSPFHSQKSSPYHSEKSSPFQSRKPRADGSTEQESRDASSGPSYSQVKYSYSNVKICNGQSYYVTVCHVNHFEEFYCQLQSSAAELQTLMSEIESHCLSSDAMPVTSPQNGSPVFAQFSVDEGWYRAQITSTPSQGKCIVLFVDYGNSESAPLEKMREIPPQFFHLSTQAFRCALYGVPHDFKPSPAAIDAFTDLTLEQNLHCFVKTMSKGEDICEVELSTNDKVTVLQKLTSAGHIPSRTLPSEVSPSHEYPHRRDYSQSPRQQDSSRSLRKQDNSQYPQQREFSQSPRQQGSSQPSWQQNSPKTRDAPFKQAAPSSSKRRETAHSVPKNVPLPQLPTNTLLDAYVSYAESPARFYLQLAESYTSLEQLCTILNETSSKDQSSEGVRPDVGTFCEAQFSEDKFWYRARVTAVIGSEVEVCFIDFGNSERVRVSKLRPLRTQCEKIPCVAVPCTFDGLPPDAAKSPQVMQKFSKLANDSKLVVEFLKPLTSYDNFVPVRLLDTSQSGVDLNIGDTLRSIPTGQQRTGTGVQPGFELPAKQPPALNSPLDCNVVFVRSPGEFYCQLNSESKAMVALMDSMYEFYAEEEKGSTITKPSVGSLCVALFSDLSWYRGKFTQITTNRVSIFYIDYGNTEDVPLSDVKSLDPQFCVLPAQALRCSLDGIAPLAGTWSPECVTKFQEAVLEQDVQVTFLRGTVSGCGFDVQLEFKGQVISQKLIEDGLAKKKDQGSIPSFTVQRGERYRVIVTAVTSPQEFYALIVDKEGRLDILMDQIAQYCSSLPPSPASTAGTSWKTGNFVLAQFTEDQGWYRAVITKILQGGIKAELRYIDYGNTETLPVSELRCLPQEFGVLPSQAVRCCLEGAQYYNYSSESLAAFNMLLLNIEFQMKCVAMTETHCAVDLKRLEDDSDLMNYAIQQKIVEPRSVDNTLLPSPNSLQKPENATGGKNAIEIVTKFPELDLDSFYDVTVSHVESPSLFYCHFSLYMQEHLTMVMSQLQEVCTTDRKKPSEMKCSEGDFVAVQFSGDELWYRAQVCDASSEEVVVCFVDYGNEEAVPYSKIQYLDPEFAKLPAQAVPCSLAEVLPKEGVDWSDDSVDKFYELVLDKPFVAQVKSASVSAKKFQFGDNQTVGVSLIEEECPVSEELVRLGYAKLTTTVPSEHESAEEKSELAEEKTNLAEVKSALLPSPGKSLEENFLSISVGTEHEVFVTNVESPSCFWFQLASSEDDLNTLGENLEAAYRSGNPPTLSNPAVGMQCCAKFSEDDIWYRGIVRSVTPNGIDIQFIDYGNSEVVGPSDVKVLNPEFLNLPVQSIKCKLIDCHPPGRSEWTDKAIGGFSSLVMDKPLVAQFVRMSPDGGSWEVRLSDDGADVSAKLMEISVPKEVVQLGGTKPTSTEPPELELPKEKPESAEEKGALLPSSQQSLEENVLSISVGAEHEVFVTNVESPSCFWFQLASSEEDLNTLGENLEAAYRSGNPPTLNNPAVGMQCCAKFSEDDIWYRGIVRSVTPNGIDIQFIDYGNSEVVGPSDVKVLNPEFLNLPVQSIKCKLIDCHPPGRSEWTDKAIGGFSSLVMDKPLVAQFVRMSPDGGSWEVRLSDDGADVSAKLMEISVPKEVVQLGGAKPTSTVPPELELPKEKPESAEEKGALLPSSQISLKENVLSISVGAEHEVFMTNIESPSCFWFQLASSEDDLNTLGENLEAAYHSGNPPTLSNPAVGMQCCAKFSEDDIWYRGIVRSVTPNGIDIQFIDYGNSEVLGPSDVKVLNPEFLDLPVQSIKCKLIDCHPRGRSEWTDKAIAGFSSLVMDKPLVAQFVRMSPGGGSWEVRLSDDGADVSAKLMESGAAGASEAHKDLKIPDLNLKENEMYSVYIAVTASPTEFYVQLSSECDRLESLMALVADYYNGNQPSAPLEVGRYCVAQYTGNNAWYRAKIVQIKSEEAVTVLFVDYGNCESISSNQILALKEEFSLLPAQAACCSITHDLTHQFSDDKLEEFFSLDFEQEFQIRISGKQNGRYIVQLLGQDATQISDTLLSPSTTTEGKFEHTFTPLGYTPGSSVDVYVSHINSPTSFYCQPLELAGELETMMTKLSSTMTQSPPEQIRDVVPGQACLARFSADNEWYRSIVNDVANDGNILVTFVDYGNSEMTTLDHLAMLPDAFLSTRLQAVHCSVFESMDAETEWPPEKVEAFQNQIPESDHFTLTVTGVSERDQVFVEIATNGDSVNFADLLEDHVDKSADVANTAQGTATFRPIPADDHLANQFANISIQDSTEISTLAVKGSKTPSTEVETESENGAEGEPLIRAPFKLSLAVREEFEGTMVYVQSPSLMFIQRVDCQAELGALSEEIEQYCAGFAGKPFQDVFRQGDFVLARYSLDELWYRAEVLEVTSESSARVSFIDFGNTETISFESMTMCPENFLELPVQAIPCSLAQVPHRDSWPPNYKELIDSLVEGRVLKVGVVIPASQGMRSTVTLSDLESGVNIAQPVLDQLQEECEEGVIDEVSMDVSKEEIKDEVIAAAQKVVLPERNFDIGHSYEVYLACCTSPHSFVCQLVGEEDALENVTTQLAQQYSSDSDLHALVGVAMEGDVVCGQFSEDNQWYRARVLSTEGEECEVLYVDFGNMEIVPSTRLRALAPSLSSQPPLAFECFLSGVESPTGDGQFDQLASKKMLELVGEESATLEIHSVDTSGHLGVILTTSHGVDVSASLIEAGLATLLVPTPLATPSTATIPSSQSTSDQIDDGGTPLVIDKPISVPSTLDELDDPEEPLPVSQDLFQESGSSFPEPSSSTQEDRDAVCAVAYPQHSLQPGARLRVVVTAVSSLDEFTCQVSDETAGLQELSGEIAARHYTVESGQLALKDPHPGLPVCACSTKDDMWYRAVVISISKLPDSVTVRYIDYGNSEELVLQRVKHLEQCFANALPPLAITCSLLVLCERDLNPNIPDEVEPWELMWPMSCASHFSQLVLKKDLDLEVVNTQENGTFVVKLIDSPAGTDIRETIVAKLCEPKLLQLEEEEEEETLNGEFHDALDTENDQPKPLLECIQQLSVEEEGEKGAPQEGEKGGPDSVSKQEDLESEEDEWTDAREGESSHMASEDVSDYQEVREEEEEGEVRGEAEVEVEEEKVVEEGEGEMEKGEMVEGKVVEKGEVVEEEEEVEREVVEEKEEVKEGEVVEEGEEEVDEGAPKEPLSDVELEPAKQWEQEWVVVQTQDIPAMLVETQSESQGEPVPEGAETVNKISTVLQQGQVSEPPVDGDQSGSSPLDTPVTAAMLVDSLEVKREGGELEQAVGLEEGGGGTLSGTVATSLDSPPVEEGPTEEEFRDRERQPLDVEQREDSTSLDTPVTAENLPDSVAIEDITSQETPVTTDSPPDSTAIEDTTSLETPVTADSRQAVEGEGDSTSLDTPVTTENPPDSTEDGTSLETAVTADSTPVVEGDRTSLATVTADRTAIEAENGEVEQVMNQEEESATSTLGAPLEPPSLGEEEDTSEEEEEGVMKQHEEVGVAGSPRGSLISTSPAAGASMSVEQEGNTSLVVADTTDLPASTDTTDPSRDTADPSRDTADPSRDTADPSQDTSDPSQDTSQLETDSTYLSPEEADTTDPSQVEADTADPSQLKTDTTDSSKLETDTADPSQLETDTADPSQLETDTADPSKLETDTTDPSQQETDTTDPSQLETDTTDPSQLETDTADPSRLETNTADPSRLETNTTDPSRLETNTADPSRLETDTADLSRLETDTTDPSPTVTGVDPLEIEPANKKVCNGENGKTSQCSGRLVRVRSNSHLTHVHI